MTLASTTSNDISSSLLAAFQPGAQPLPVEPGTKEKKKKKKPQQLNFKEAAAVVDFAKAKLDLCAQPRIAFEQQWYLNLAFYAGKQYVAWSPGAAGTLTKLYEPPAPPYRVRLVVNRCRRIIRTELSKVTRQDPVFYVLPNTTDESDRMAALAAQAIAEYELDALHFSKKKKQAVLWSLLCGSAFIKTYWDENKIDPSGQQGSVCFERITPFHAFVPDIQEEDVEDQPFLFHTVLRDAQEIFHSFGVQVEPNAEVRGGALEQRFFSALGIKSSAPSKNKVQCYEFWVKPCGKYPEGAFIIYANNTLLYYQDHWPYSRMEFPFAKIDHIPTGRFYGESILVDEIPLQREFNRSHSQIIEAKNKMAKPQWVAQKGSVDANKMTSEPGLVIQFTPGFSAPEPVQPPQLPTYVLDERESIANEMDDLAATGEITKGNVPPGITAASAISYLQEENDNRFAPTVGSIEDAVERCGQWLLTFVNDYWVESRKIKVVGENKLLEMSQFSNSDVAGNTDFRVQAGSAAPRSLAAKQAYILELVKMGMIDQKMGLKYLGMVETTKLYEDMQIDENQIQREHILMKQGQPVTVNEFDDDAAHWEGHGRFMKTQEYASLPPEIQQIFLGHYMETKNATVMQAMEDQQMAMMMNPAPEPGEGQPVSQRNGAPNEQR